MDAFQILVIILSVLLAIFLLLAIVLTVVVIKLTREIKTVADGAKTTVQHFAAAATNVRNVTDPIYVGRFIGKFFEKLKKQ